MKLNLVSNNILQLSLVVLLAGACATSVDRPVNELATAEASLTLAEQNGAQELSTEQYTIAREKLKRAKTLSADEKYGRARQLAVEAEVDARLAASMASLKKSERAADELDAGIETLDSELEPAN